ncbi:hypothetical protein [uncultured Porphyromonas sp.]|uniref:hypothetical protein n=1 Tax=uncultured Porphyromonas sp. TaxID=159274 RepID=UPI00260E3A6B|nr:hypothetical protein [uncultured Porphyromonas sp.]
MGGLLNSNDCHRAICLDSQSDFLSEGFGGGHSDDAFGGERGGGEERAEEDEEPNA